RSTRGGRSPARRAGRCRGSSWRCGTGSFTRPEWSCEPYETSTDTHTTGDHLRGHQPDRQSPGGAATVALDGDDERLAGRGLFRRLAGGAGECGLLPRQPLAAAAGLLPPGGGEVTWDRPRCPTRV